MFYCMFCFTCNRFFKFKVAVDGTLRADAYSTRRLV